MAYLIPAQHNEASLYEAMYGAGAEMRRMSSARVLVEIQSSLNRARKSVIADNPNITCRCVACIRLRIKRPNLTNASPTYARYARYHRK